jgi:predicted enzyme involved in methoxymalonyl-ACP biosynthesis
LLWPLILLLAIQYIFPQSKFAKDNWHLYTFLIIEAFNLFSILTSDSINEIVIDKSKKRIEISYFNIYQGNMEEAYPFTEINLNIETTHKAEVKQISFYIKKRADFILTKDNFGSQDLESLKELLYSLTSLKKG